MAKRNTYNIPDNFVDDEKIFGGKFRKRNFLEGVLVAIPIFGFFYLINWATNIGWGTLAYPTGLFVACGFFLGNIGYNGDSWGETFLLAQKFRTNPYNISTFNPRIKTELTADYLANPTGNSKAEAIRKFINSINETLAGAKGQSEISDDLTSDKTILYYLEDEGIVEKPHQLKTAAEIKEDAKRAKREAAQAKKAQREYLMTLGPKERKIAKAKFKAEALEKAEKERKQREADLKIYREAVEKREKEEAEKIQLERGKKNAEREKKQREKAEKKRAAAEHRAELKRIRQENTRKEKEAVQAKKKKLEEKMGTPSKGKKNSSAHPSIPDTKEKELLSVTIEPQNAVKAPEKKEPPKVDLPEKEPPRGPKAEKAKKKESAASNTEVRPNMVTVPIGKKKDVKKDTSLNGNLPSNEKPLPKVKENIAEKHNAIGLVTTKNQDDMPEIRSVPDLAKGHDVIFGLNKSSGSGFYLNNSKGENKE